MSSELDTLTSILNRQTTLLNSLLARMGKLKNSEPDLETVQELQDTLRQELEFSRYALEETNAKIRELQ
jgi:hypothetical protein